MAMRRLTALLVFVVTLIFCTPAFADDQAQEILKQARKAIGGEGALEQIQGLDINGKYTRMLGDRQMGGDRDVSIMLPDKYLVEDAFNPGGLSTALVTTRGMNGEHAWNASSGGGGNMIFRMGGPGGQQASPEEIERLLRRQCQIELTRYLLAILVTPPPSLPLEYKYAGESEVDDAKADVLDVTGPDKFAVRLFFDKQSHLPLLLSYRGIKPRIMTMTRSVDSGGNSAEALKKAREEAEKKMAGEPGQKPEEVDFFIRLSEHKKSNGLLLPYKLTFLTDTDVSEEFEISKYQVNPQFKSDKFQKH